ncbi:MAG TPA: hypothetical protein VFT99_24860 [Roseiflexaceae bacterium]|nr:hypothetical protein [Roseiflexaceae bacterium]
MNPTRLFGAFVPLASAWVKPGAYAEPCSVTMVDACVAMVDYDIWYGVAMLIWQIDRMLLQAAYQLQHVRWWLITQAFSSAFEAIRAAFEPLVTPAATLAAMLGLLLVLCVPMLGRIEIINIRQALVWAMLGPLLLAQAGPLLLEMEATRDDIGNVLVAQIGQSVSGIFAGVPSDGEPTLPPQPLYENGDMCPGGVVRRPAPFGQVGAGAALRLDDLAAAFVLADAQDIHCPNAQQPSRTLPDRFFEPGGYAFDGDLSDSGSMVEMKVLAERMKSGVVRLALGLAPGVVALMESLIQLLFTAALVVLWLILSILMLSLLFSRDLRPLGELLRRVTQIVVTSWVVTMLLALMSICFMGAARSANPSAYAALTLGGGFLVYRMLRVALDLFSASLVGAGSIVGGSSGAALAGASVAVGSGARHVIERVVTRSVRAASSLGSAGTQTVAGAAGAYRQSGNRRYSAGPIQPIARAGMLLPALDGPDAGSSAAIMGSHTEYRNNAASLARSARRGKATSQWAKQPADATVQVLQHSKAPARKGRRTLVSPPSVTFRQRPSFRITQRRVWLQPAWPARTNGHTTRPGHSGEQR